MRRSTRQQEIEELVSTFETALNDYGAISKSEMEEYVAKELQGRYGPDDLQRILPRKVWEDVHLHLAEGRDSSKHTEKHQAPALSPDMEQFARRISEASGAPYAQVAKDVAQREEGLRALKRHLNKSPSVADTILSRFYDTEPSTIRKSTSSNPALQLIDEADLT